MWPRTVRAEYIHKKKTCLMNILYRESDLYKEHGLTEQTSIFFFCMTRARSLSPDHTAVLFSSDKVSLCAQIWTQADPVHLLPRVTVTCVPVSISHSFIP